MTKCFVDDRPIAEGNRLQRNDGLSDSNTCLTSIGVDSSISQDLKRLISAIGREDSFNLRMMRGGVEIDQFHDTIEKLTQASEHFLN